MSVAEPGPHIQLLICPVVQNDMIGNDLDFRDTGFVFPGTGGTGCDPFGQHQASRWIAEINATAQSLAGKNIVIPFVIVASERQLKPILARGCAVASPCIAAGFCEHRLHVVAKTPFEWMLHSCNRDFGGCFGAVPSFSAARSSAWVILWTL